MKSILIIFCGILALQAKAAELILPPDIAQGISKSTTGESGGLFVCGVERDRFIGYICENWREIADHVEDLPKAEGSFVTKDGAFNCSVNTFATACEWLPPQEYVDFLDKLADLYEQKRIGYLAIELSGSAKKDGFLGVNWYHPRVKAYLERLKKLAPPEHKDIIERMASGKLDDNYMVNMPDDAPLPETLPGVRLKRPLASMIPNFERLTGRKVPPDPRFPEESGRRPVRRPGTENFPTAPKQQSMSGLPGSARIWSAAFFCAAAALFIALMILRRIRRKAHAIKSN